MEQSGGVTAPVHTTPSRGTIPRPCSFVAVRASSIRSGGGVLVEPNFAGESIRVAELDRRIIARESTILMLSGITPALTSSG